MATTKLGFGAAMATTIAGRALRLNLPTNSLLNRWSYRGAASTDRQAKSTLTDSNNSFYRTAESNADDFDREHDYTHTPCHSYVRVDRIPVRSYPRTPQKVVSHVRGIGLPPYARSGIVTGMGNSFVEEILIHGDDSIQRMRKAARVARKVLGYACSLAKPNVTTDEIDQLVHEKLLRLGAYPSPLNYSGFPKSLCSSINEVICHGIPDSRPLLPGDIVSFDVSCFIGGVHGDNCATVVIPSDDPQCREYMKAKRLVQATEESLAAAISTCRPGSCLTQVGEAIHDIADAYGYDTVQKYRGHGIGTLFHCPPFVKHFRNTDYLELREGMIFTIEPMLTEGLAHDCEEWPQDGWTVATMDGGRAAQFEHTVLITKNGVEILTVPDNDI